MAKPKKKPMPVSGSMKIGTGGKREPQGTKVIRRPGARGLRG